MSKSILILKATKDICGNEIGLIEHNCQLLEMEVEKAEIHSEEQLSQLMQEFASKGKCFDYVYLCTHGSPDGFEVDMGGNEIFIEWSNFAGIICENGVFGEGAILLLACCKGGMFQVACDIFSSCANINFMCGVKWNVSPWDLTTGFVVFIHNIENKDAEPSYAAQKASLATDYTFVCYDRDEVEINQTYRSRRYALYWNNGYIDKNGIVTTSDKKVLENIGYENGDIVEL